MIYPHLDLRVVSLVVGIWLLISHGFALARPALVQRWLRAFPRSKRWAAVLVVVDAVWALTIVATMDLGEFSHLRMGILVVIVVATFLAFRYVDEFLAVRALGIFLLLAAEPLIEAAFLQPQEGRLLLVAIAYLMAILGMVWVGLPYVLRDQIDWVRKSRAVWSAAALGGIIYGVLLAGFALVG